MVRNLLAALGMILCVPLVAAAQGTAAPPIRYLPELKLWVLETERTSYVVGVNELNELQQVYWGAKITHDQDLAAAHSGREHASFDSSETMTAIEYPGWGGKQYNEPCLKVTLADGVRDLVLKYVSYENHGDELMIRLKDIRYDLFVNLPYRVFAREDIIRKQAVIENRTAQVVTVESAQSGAWYLPPGEGYQLTYLSGRWAAESQINREPIH